MQGYYKFNRKNFLKIFLEKVLRLSLICGNINMYSREQHNLTERDLVMKNAEYLVMVESMEALRDATNTRARLHI